MKKLWLACAALTVLLMLQACGQSQQAIIINFEPRFHQQSVNCEQTISIDGRHWQVTQLQFYLSDLKIMQQGKNIALGLPSNKWQHQGIFLLGGACDGEFNWQLPLQIEQLKNNTVDVSFTIGVPAELNHGNPLQAPSPLNQSDMFWSWQLGHKYFRLDLESDSHGWAFHAGAMGCKSASVLRPPESPCLQPNLARVVLRNIDLAKPISLDLAKLLTGIALTQASRCMSSLDVESCALLLTRLGVGKNSVVFSGEMDVSP